MINMLPIYKEISLSVLVLLRMYMQAAVLRSRQSSPCPHRSMSLRRSTPVRQHQRQHSGSCSEPGKPVPWSNAAGGCNDRTCTSSLAASTRSSACGLRGSSEQQQQQQQHTQNSGSSISWLRHQLELLASKNAAEERQQQLQVRHAEVTHQHEQLLSAKAQLDIKALRRWVNVHNRHVKHAICF